MLTIDFVNEHPELWKNIFVPHKHYYWHDDCAAQAEEASYLFYMWNDVIYTASPSHLSIQATLSDLEPFLKPLEDWSEAKEYKVGDVVLLDGAKVVIVETSRKMRDLKIKTETTLGSEKTEWFVSAFTIEPLVAPLQNATGSLRSNVFYTKEVRIKITEQHTGSRCVREVTEGSGNAETSPRPEDFKSLEIWAVYVKKWLGEK